MGILSEAFKKLDLLDEDVFDTSTDSFEKLKDFDDNDEYDDSISVIDDEAETEDDLQDSYVGKVILDCNVCHSKIYKDKEEVTVDVNDDAEDGENAEVANVSEECPFCFSTEGFTVLGEVAPFEDEEPEEEIDVEATDEDGEEEDVDVEIEDSEEDEDKKEKKKNEGLHIRRPRRRREFTEECEGEDCEDMEEGILSSNGLGFGRQLRKAQKNESTTCEDVEEGLGTLGISTGDVLSGNTITIGKKDEDLEESSGSHGMEDLFGLNSRRRANESMVRGIRKILRRMNESPMSDEDRHDTDILRGILQKSEKRRNAKLTPEEKEVMDKYGLQRDWGGQLGSRSADLTLGITAKEKGPWGSYKRMYDSTRDDEVNLADRARKMDARADYRGFLHGNRYDYTAAEATYGGDKKYRPHTTQLDSERMAHNTRLHSKVNQMKQHLRDRDYNTSRLDSLDKDYRKKMDDLQKEWDSNKDFYGKELANTNKSINRLLKKESLLREAKSSNSFKKLLLKHKSEIDNAESVNDIISVIKKATSGDVSDEIKRYGKYCLVELSKMKSVTRAQSFMYNIILAAEGNRSADSKRAVKVDESWRGCSNIEMIPHGTQADPDLVYNGHTFNYYDIEDALWWDFLEETGYSDSMATDPKVEDEFDKFCQRNAEDYLEDVLFGMGNPEQYNWHRESFNRRNMKESFDGKIDKADIAKWMQSVLSDWESDGRPENVGTWLYGLSYRLKIAAASSDSDAYGDGVSHLEFNIGVVDDLPDYEWMTLPYPCNNSTGDVWNSEISVDSVADIKSSADWLAESAEEILQAFKNGEVTCGDERWDDKIVEDYFGYVDDDDDYMDESCGSRKRKYSRNVSESIENVDVDTGDQIIHVSTEEKMDDMGDFSTSDDEMIAPLSDETAEEIADNSVFDDEAEDEDENEEEVDIDEVDEDSFDELGESYLKKIYNNVKSYRTSGVSSNCKSLKLEGIITFNSGKTKKTSFILEAHTKLKGNRVRFIGENAQISNGKKAFTFTGRVKNKKFFTESLNYNYNAKDAKTGKSKRVYGTINK